MATATATGMTAEEFAAWVQQPGQRGAFWELDRGRVVEVPPPQDPHGTLCSWISHLLWAFAIQRGRGRVASNDMGLIVEERPDTVRGVDVMFFDESLALGAIVPGYPRHRPALVVEVWSPNDRRNAMNRRVAQYLNRGIPLVWLVDPDDQTVAVHRPGEIPLVAHGAELLLGYDALPDLTFAAANLFNFPGTAPTA